MGEAKKPTTLDIRRVVHDLLYGGQKIPLDKVTAKIERDFKFKADDEVKGQIREIYIEISELARDRRRRSAAYKLFFIAGFCIGLVILLSISPQYTVPGWVKICLLVLGIPAWFLGINTFFSKKWKKAQESAKEKPE